MKHNQKKYYTDFHYVDEDIMAIAHHGGRWTWETSAGITNRYMDNAPTFTQDVVASRKNKPPLM